MNLNHVTIPSLNVSKAIEFYKKLGLNLIVHTKSDYARFECVEGNSTFSIHAVNELKTIGGIWVYFECEDLDNKVEELVNQGVSIDEMPNDKPWLWREARLKDLDGNQIVLFKAGKARKNPPWKYQE